MRITDSALVAAATLSHRYITDRFLPDKAIDLMDEAASRLRMEVDSKPEELDALDRQILQCQIEIEALKKEDDAASKDRLEKLTKELADLTQQAAEMTARWQAERDKLEAARGHEGSSWTRRGRNWNRPSARATFAARASCSTGSIPGLEKKLAEAEAREGDVLVAEAVWPEQIAEVVERWTGHSHEPDAGRRAGKAAADGRGAGQARDRAAAGGDRRGQCRAACPGGLNDENRPLGSFLFLGPTGVGKTELTKARGRVPVRRRGARWCAST